jgi:hypothetical protein
MFGFNLLQTIIGGIAAISVSFLAGALYGNSYGNNAYKLASAQAQLNATNKALKTLQAEDAVIAAEEWERASQRASDFAKTAPTLKKCILDKDQVDALNKLTDGG